MIETLFLLVFQVDLTVIRMGTRSLYQVQGDLTEHDSTASSELLLICPPRRVFKQVVKWMKVLILQVWSAGVSASTDSGPGCKKKTGLLSTVNKWFFFS